MSTIFLAIIIGASFGVVLDRVGATNPNYIGKMLNLTNLHLAKTILLAIGVGSVLMFGGQKAGLVDVGHMSVKTAYTGVFIGGLLLGVGWAASGYCPGTGLAAAASGRRDALVYAAGGLVGAAAYMVTYPIWKSAGVLSGNALTLGAVPGAEYDALLPGISGDLAGILVGVALIVTAFMLPDRIISRQITAPAE
ncbi:MAG: YeeE/YedE family protein [Anderseniella sp.]|nr:YeeE/YedE family protein [Anderseniella sp.]